MITLNSSQGFIDINPEEIAMIQIPPLRYFMTLRGYGSVITLRFGKRLHVKEEPYEVRRMIREAMEE